MNHQRKSALAEFFHSNYNRLVNYVRCMIDDSAHRSSEDIVQDVMLKILDRSDIMALISDLPAYVLRSLKNRIIDHYRSSEKEIVSLDSEHEDGLSLFDVLPDTKYDPEGSYHRHALRRLIFEMIRELPEAQMEVIIETEKSPFHREMEQDYAEFWREEGRENFKSWMRRENGNGPEES